MLSYTVSQFLWYNHKRKRKRRDSEKCRVKCWLQDTLYLRKSISNISCLNWDNSNLYRSE